MSFKKLISELTSGLKDAGFDENIREIQKKSISQIKSGTDIFIISTEGSGKSTAMVISVIQQLKKSLEQAPRAIIVVPTKEKAIEIETQFAIIGTYTNLRTFVAFDKGKIQYQKDMIYEGIDILIATPKRLNELMKITGVPITKIKMFVVDDATDFKPEKLTMIYGVADCLGKSQFIVLANRWNNNFTKFAERLMKNPKIIKSQ